MRLPISSVWEETMAFVRREWALLAPVALALLGISNAVSDLTAGAMGPNGPAGAPAWTIVVFILTILVSQFGQLALMAMALMPGISVREALGIGLRRLPKLIAITLILGLAGALLVIPFAAYMAANGIDAATSPANLPLGASFLLMMLLWVMVWVFVRLLPLNAALMDRDLPVMELLRHSFATTRGHFAVLFGLSALFMLVSLIATTAASAVFGTLFGLLGKATGLDAMGAIIGALAGGAAAAMLGMISAVFVAKLYRALTAA
jgi:hypothetical protein